MPDETHGGIRRNLYAAVTGGVISIIGYEFSKIDILVI